jgi:hypothetical protein
MNGISKYHRTLFQTSLAAKVLLILLATSSLRIFFSCTPPPPNDMTYNAIKLSGVDNSDRFMKRNAEVDTLYAGAVAFRLTLSDSTLHYAKHSVKSAQMFAFKQAMALSPAERTFLPTVRVTEIKTFTLFHINGQIKAGDDVSSRMVFDGGSDFELYQTTSSAIDALNRTQIGASGSVIMVLKDVVEGSNAQFRVEVTFEDGSQLIATTNLFTLIQP